MTLRDLMHPLKAQLSCVGSGLVTLDVVVDAESPDQYVTRSGGSCGNVMNILSYLGWRTYPVTRLGQDQAAQVVLDDLAQFGVDTAFIIREEVVSTPTIIEGVRTSKSKSRTHSYTLHCPSCGNNLLRYRAISQELTEQVMNEIENTQVFYFDRITKGILRLARHYREQGALIVFEPSAIRDERLFSIAAHLAHILKYSRERLPDVADVLGNHAVPLEIQTLGREGLRYRRRLGKGQSTLWQYMPAFRISDVVDEAGAGDWCTSGIIHSLGRYGAASFWRTRNRGIGRALELGQALAAVNCRFRSARGAMYSLSQLELKELVLELTAGQALRTEQELPPQGVLDELLQWICPRCSQGERLAALLGTGRFKQPLGDRSPGRAPVTLGPE